MAGRSFSITANLVMGQVLNLAPMVTKIQTAIGSIKANVNVNVNATAASNVNKLNYAFAAFNTTLKTTSVVAQDAAVAIRTLSNAVNTMNTRTLTTQLHATTAAVHNVGKSVKTVNSELFEFGRVGGLAIRRFTGFLVGTTAIFGFLMKMKEGIGAAIEFQHQTMRLSQLAGVSMQGMKPLTDEIVRLSTTLGVSSAQLMSISDTLIQAGLSATDTKLALDALAKTMLAPAFEDVEKTTEGVIAIMGQFKLKANELEGALSSMHAVSAAFAVEADDLITAVRTAGGSFATMSQGIDTGQTALNKFMALFTSVRATTRESAESIATGLRTIFTRLERPQTLLIFKQLGVDLTDAQGKFVGVYEAINRVSMAMQQLDPRDLRFAQLAEALGGYRQMGKVIPLIMQSELRVKALGVAEAGEAQLAETAAKAQQSWNVQLTKTNERFLALIRNISQTTGFEAIMKAIIGLTNAFIKLGEVMAPLMPYITVIAGIKAVSMAKPILGGALSGLRSMGTRGMASGGKVPGYGEGDVVPAALTPGEFVINKSAANRLGPAFLNALNTSGAQRMAGGGGVQGTLFDKDMGTFGYNANPITKIAKTIDTQLLLPFDKLNQKFLTLKDTLPIVTKATGPDWWKNTRQTDLFSKNLPAQWTTSPGIAPLGVNTQFIDRSNANYDMVSGLGPTGRSTRGWGMRGALTGMRGAYGATNQWMGANMTKLGIGAFMGATLLNQVAPENKTAQGIAGGLMGGAAGGMLTGGPGGAIVGAIVGAISSVQSVSLLKEQREANKALTISTKALDKAFIDFEKSGNIKNMDLAFMMASAATTKQVEAGELASRQQMFGLAGLAMGENKGGFENRALARRMTPTFGFGNEEALQKSLKKTKAESELAEIAAMREASLQSGFTTGGVNLLESMRKRGQYARSYLKGEKTDFSTQAAVVGYMRAHGSDTQNIEMEKAGTGAINESQRIKFMFASIEREFKQLIGPADELSQKMELVTNAFTKADAELVLLNDALSVMAAQFKTIADVGGLGRVQTESIIARQGGRGALTKIPMINMFENPEAYSGTQLAGAGRGTIGRFGGTNSYLKHALTMISGGKAAQANLSNVAMGWVGQLMGATADVTPTITQATTGLPPRMQRLISTKLATWSEKEGGSLSLGAFQEKGGIEEINKMIDTELKSKYEVMSEIVKQQIGIQERYREALSQQLTAQLQLNDKIANQIQFRTEAEMQLGQILRSHEITAGEAFAPTRARMGGYAQAAGIGAGNFANIGMIGERIEANRAERVQLEAKAATLPAGSNELKKISDTLAAIEIEDAAARKLLEINHTDNTLINGILGELKNIEDKREAARKTGLDILKMNPQELAKNRKNVQAFTEFQQTGILPKGIRQGQAIQGFEFIKSLGMSKEMSDEWERRLFKAGMRRANFIPSQGGLWAGAIQRPGEGGREGELIGGFIGAKQRQNEAGEMIIKLENRDINIMGTIANINFGKEMARGGRIIQGAGQGGVPFEQVAMILSNSLDNFAKLKIPENIAMTVAPIQHTHTITGDSSLANAVVSSISTQLNTLIDLRIKSFLNPDTGETKPVRPGTPIGSVG